MAPGTVAVPASPDRRQTAVPGPVLFARYAFGPNRLGYCGTDDHAAVLGHAAAGQTDPLRELAKTFEGAYPYLELIARANGIADPLDRRVVEAYWLGNRLTTAVTQRALHASLGDRFRPRVSAAAWRWLEATVSAGARPVHAFHVLDIFTRVGLLRGETADNAMTVMDSCRVRWGRVITVDGPSVIVDVRALELRDGRLALGAPRSEVVQRWVDGTGFVDEVGAGEMISIHWGWACDRLAPGQLRNLQRWTSFELAVANQTI